MSPPAASTSERTLTYSLPAAEAATHWVEAILEHWDSPDVYERASRRALIEARRWASESLEPRYERFFAMVGLNGGPPDTDDPNS
jgi:hypothetical protein